MKPKYRVKTMAEISAEPRNGFVVASLFSGCGGSSTGYKMAGYSVCYANEFIHAARESYQANHPQTHLDPRDIRDVQPHEILDAIGIGVGELDILDGSPPCAAFSLSGKREKGWGKKKKYSDGAQIVDDLFFEYARILRGIKPKVFIAENVKGLVIGKAKGYYLEILAELKSCGYKVRSGIINAAYCGVPQKRERLIFIGVREDIGIEPTLPKPLPYTYTLTDALENLCAPIEPETLLPPSCAQEWKRCSIGKGSDKYYNLQRPSLRDAVGTIVATACQGAGIYHPTQCRRFSIAEAKRLSSFPDDYILTGTYKQQYERIGRAVPPVMMAHIAAHVRDTVLKVKK